MGGNGDHPRVQAAEEGRHEVQARRIEQERPPARRDRTGQRRGDGAGAPVQAGIGEPRRDLLSLGEIGIAAVRTLHRAAMEECHQGLHQSRTSTVSLKPSSGVDPAGRQK
jgi:hypothetical protein